MKSIIGTTVLIFATTLIRGQHFDHKSGEYLTSNGAKIYYEETGKKDGPILLLLHGGFGNIEDFNSIIPALSDNFRIIGIDSRGHGKSTMDKKGLTYELIQKDVEAILSHLKIDSLSIIGHSDGGIVAYRLASISDLNISKIITIGSRWHYKNGIPMHGLWSIITAEYIGQQFPHLRDSYINLNPEPDFNRFTEALSTMWMNQEESGHPNERVSSISCPVLIVRGDTDPFISQEDIVELSKLIENMMILSIPFAGHNAHIEQKEVFLDTALKFLNE